MNDCLIIPPPPENWWQRNRKHFHLHPAVQAAIVTGLFAATGFLIKSHSDATRLQGELSDAQGTIAVQSQKLSENTADIQRLETLLAPFRTIALDRFTGPESEALQKLADQVGTIARSISDKTEEIALLKLELERSQPEKQVIRSASAKVSIDTAAEGTAGGMMDFKLFAALGFGDEGQRLLVLRNTDLKYRRDVVTNGVLRYTFVVEKDLTEDYGTYSLESLACADSLHVSFGILTNQTAIVGGNITCTFNGSIQRTFVIPSQIYKSELIIPISKENLITK